MISPRSLPGSRGCRAALALTLSLLGASPRDAAADTFASTLQIVGIDNASPYLVASEPGGRDAVLASASVHLALDGEGLPVSGKIAALFRLLDAEGTAVPLANASGDPLDPAAVRSEGFAFELEKATQPELVAVIGARLVPAVALRPDTTYVVSASIVRDVDGAADPVIAGPGTSTAFPFIHFANTTPDDPARDVVAQAMGASFGRRFAVDTIATLGTFPVHVPVLLHRLDRPSLAPASSAVPVRVQVTLRDAATLAVVGTGTTHVSVDVVSHQGGVPRQPGMAFTEVEVGVTPNAPIAPTGMPLVAVATVLHEESAGLAYVEDAVATSEPASLLRFTGELRFGVVPVAITGLAGDPSIGAVPTDGGLACTLAVTSGHGLGDAAQAFVPAGPVPVVLGADGIARARAGALGELRGAAFPSPVVGEANGLRYRRSPAVTLTHLGGSASFTLVLPPGLGASASPSSRRLLAELPVGDQPVGASLGPEGLVPVQGGPWFLVEETKPVRFLAAGLQWDVDAGRLRWESTSATYVRAAEMTALAEAPGDVAPRKHASNEAVFAAVTGPFSPAMSAGVDAKGGASLDAELTFGPGSALAHFPLGAAFSWSGGRMKVVADLVSAEESALEGAFAVTLPVFRGCAGDDCGEVAAAASTLTLTPLDGILGFTRDAGLAARGTFGAPTTLRWGYHLSAGVEHPAHEALAFAKGNFVMAGSFLRGGETGRVMKDRPGVLLLSGFKAAEPDAPGTRERPGTAAYAQGLADYAGINVRAADLDGTPKGRARLGGAPSGDFTLTSRSKLYARAGGVNGIQEAVPGTFPEALEISGYAVSLGQFGLAFLDGAPVETRTEGAVDLPFPAQFGLEFERMAFSCSGAPREMTLAGEPAPAVLAWWLADFTPLSAAFAAAGEDPCDPATARLVVGVEAWSAHVPTPLHGSWAFAPDGRLLSGAEAQVEGYNGRLALPGKVRFQAPEGREYRLVPVTEAYLSDYPGDPGAEAGFIAFAGRLDVAFFEDLPVVIHTAPAKENTTAPVHVTGGWSVGDDTFFTATLFDPTHRGHPAGVTLAEYRAGGDGGQYQAAARKSWLGIVDFAYPVEWSGATRSFRGVGPQENKLVVLTTQHELLYLSDEDAELSFGAAYEGLPRVRLGELLVNTIDEQTGGLSALREAVTAPAADALDRGVEELAAVVSERAEQLFASALDAALDPVLDALVADLQASWNPVLGDFVQDPVVLVEQRLLGPGSTVRGRLPQVLGALDDATSTLARIDRTLADVQGALRSIHGQLAFDEADLPIIDPGPAVAYVRDGILRPDDQGRYPVARRLVALLLEQFAPEIASNLAAVLPLGELEAKLDEILGGAKPTLDQVRVVLVELDDAIGSVREGLAPAGQFAGELQAILAPAAAPGGAFDLVAGGASQELGQWLATLRPEGGGARLFDEYSEEELRARLVAAITDRFFGSAFVGSVQVRIRARLHDVRSSVNEAIDGAFAQLDEALRALLSNALSGLEQQYAGFADDLASKVGAARIDGYAHIEDDSLRLLRLDVELKLGVPDDLEFRGYVQISELDSEGDGGCSYGGGTATEVKLGALGVPARWAGSQLRFDVEAKFTLGQVEIDGVQTTMLRGMGGSIALVEGVISFEAFKITQFAAGVAFGLDENYLAARVGVEFDGYEMAGGIFFGRTCTLDPIRLVDPDVADVLGAPPFTGAYVYGEVYMGIVNYGCLFRISAGVGAGAFVFVEGPTYGGKVKLAAGGEVLCLVEAKGEITMVGSKSGDEFTFLGKGRIQGRVGWCPICVEFDRMAKAIYRNDTWEVIRE